MFKDLKEIIKEYWLWIVVLVIGIIATFCIFYFSNDCTKAGTIGDTLSGVFTSLAFICAMFAVALQRKELSLQREELKQTREELKGQKEQFEIQNKTLKRQQFENTFFNMLKTQENIISNLSFQKHIGNDPKTLEKIVSRSVFEEFYNILEKKLRGKKVDEKNIISAYCDCTEFQILDHYFRHMYRIVKFVDTTDFSFCLDNEEDKKKTQEEKKKKIKDEKYQYTSILRATLSPYEFPLIFYNCLQEDNKLKHLVVKYKLLQNIRSGFLRKEILDLYKDEAYKAYGNRYEDIKKELENRA